MNVQACALCDTEVSAFPILDGERTFCCMGCHAVFNILAASDQLSHFQDTPVFKQALRSGLISNPALQEQIRSARTPIDSHELQRLHIEISGMWCPACAQVIRLILLREKGVQNCVVDYATDLLSIEFSLRYIDKEKIHTLITSLGYQPIDLESQQSAVGRDLYLRFAVAAFCSLNIMMFASPLYASYFYYEPQGYGKLFAWLSFATAVPVLGYCGWPILRHFLNSLQVGIYGMETLVVIGVTTALGLSIYDLSLGGTQVYFDSMTVIITFMLLGKIIEAKAKFSAKDSLRRLTHALPRRGRKRFSDGTEDFVPLKEICPNDILVVCSGEKIVLDGVVVKGEGSCDESLMTGEALPVLKQIGSAVLGGSILQSGSLEIRVTKLLEDSALHKIYDVVQQEIGHKTAYVRAADRIVYWFVPLILVIACMTALACWFLGLEDSGKSVTETALLRAISVLLISCPCAIGIAAPLAESHVINGLARLGAIVRNRGCLPLLGREAVFIFDKTGTITEGHFTVVSGLDSLSSTQRGLLKGLVMRSTHPIACSIAQAIVEAPVSLECIEEIAGKGLKGRTGKQQLLLGSAEFLRLHQIKVIDGIDQAQIQSSVYFACNQQCLTMLILGDRIREGAQEMVQSLSSCKTILLSGDAPSSVAAVAKACGFNEWQAGCNPLYKREVVESFRRQGHVVCMFGDGINDAPALAAANVGISVVSATDISIQVSDLLLTTDRLQVISKMRAIAHKGYAIVRQNLFWAFFYNVMGIALAVFGWMSPIFAAFAMVASSLMVLFNAKRI